MRLRHSVPPVCSTYRGLWGLVVVSFCSSVTRTLAAQTRCPGFNCMSAFHISSFLPHNIKYLESYLQCMDVVLAPWNQSHYLLQLIVRDPTVLHVCKKIGARNLATTVEVTTRAQVNSLLACDHKKVQKFHNELHFQIFHKFICIHKIMRVMPISMQAHTAIKAVKIPFFEFWVLWNINPMTSLPYTIPKESD